METRVLIEQYSFPTYLNSDTNEGEVDAICDWQHPARYCIPDTLSIIEIYTEDPDTEMTTVREYIVFDTPEEAMLWKMTN